MHRIDTEGSVASRFFDGNPQEGQPATIIDAEWLNAVQENIVDVVTFAGIGLAKGNDTQLRAAIVALIAGVVGTGGGSVPTTRNVTGGGLVTGGGPLAADLTLSVPKATAADVLAGVNDTKAITPLALATALPMSIGTSGYITLGGGLILQWFRGSMTANTTTNFSLPTTFPNACLGAFVNGGRLDTGAQDNNPFVSGDGVSTLSILNGADTGVSINVFAIGY